MTLTLTTSRGEFLEKSCVGCCQDEEEHGNAAANPHRTGNEGNEKSLLRQGIEGRERFVTLL